MQAPGQRLERVLIASALCTYMLPELEVTFRSPLDVSASSITVVLMLSCGHSCTLECSQGCSHVNMFDALPSYSHRINGHL